MAKSLRFYCDEKYALGHKCKAQIYTIEISGQSMEEQGVEDEELIMEEVKDLPILPEETPHLSINAISGVNT